MLIYFGINRKQLIFYYVVISEGRIFMDNKTRRLVALVFALVMTLIIVVFFPEYNANKSQELTYDEVVQAIDENRVEKISAKQSSTFVNITLKDDDTKYWFIVEEIEDFCIFVSAEKEKGKTDLEFEISKEGMNSTAIVSLITTMVYVLFFVYIMNQLSGGNNIKIEAVKSKVTFKDVAGIDEERRQVEEIVFFLKNPKQYEKMGARIPKGILLEGEPGTGKTLLAKAIAGEACVPFFQVNGSSFEEKFVGVGASRVRKLFQEAKKSAPAIIFIDEIDSVAKDRYSRNSYSEQTLNQLLSEMDGFEERTNIVVIAATNHAEVLDSAIKRPGRFDRTVFVPKPDISAREAILKIHARNKSLDPNVSLADVARKTAGFTGADLENVLNEAAIIAVNHNKQSIGNSEIDEAIAKEIVGLKKENTVMSDEDKWITAVHESGHAIVSAVVRPEVKNLCISIVPRGKAGGYNFFDNLDKIYRKKSDMEKAIQVWYGGRVAEEIIIGEASTGAIDDLERATSLARQMVTKLAMKDSLITTVKKEPEFNSKIDSNSMPEIEEICKSAYEKTKTTILVNKEQVLKLAEILMRKEYLSQEEVDTFMRDNI